MNARLNHPEIFDDFWLPFFSRRQRRAILQAAQQTSAGMDFQPNLVIVFRTKNDRADLAAMIKHIERERKSYKGRIDLIVVDTESKDGTVELANKAGATVVRIKQSEFNYPKSINVGLEAAKPDVEAAFVTVGHAQFVVCDALRLAARHLANPKVAAVYADAAPHFNATSTEKSLYYLTPFIYRRMKNGAHQTPRMHGGLTQATNTLVRMSVWRKHKFNEAYGHGGEDLAWGRWALKNGYTLIYDPVVVVHHSHGLGPVNFIRQMKYWGRAALTKGDFNEKKVFKYRKDLRNG